MPLADVDSITRPLAPSLIPALRARVPGAGRSRLGEFPLLHVRGTGRAQSAAEREHQEPDPAHRLPLSRKTLARTTPRIKLHPRKCLARPRAGSVPRPHRDHTGDAFRRNYGLGYPHVERNRQWFLGSCVSSPESARAPARACVYVAERLAPAPSKAPGSGRLSLVEAAGYPPLRRAPPPYGA